MIWNAWWGLQSFLYSFRNSMPMSTQVSECPYSTLLFFSLIHASVHVCVVLNKSAAQRVCSFHFFEPQRIREGYYVIQFPFMGDLSTKFGFSFSRRFLSSPHHELKQASPSLPTYTQQLHIHTANKMWKGAMGAFRSSVDWS